MNRNFKIIIGALALVIIGVLAFFFWQNWPQKQEEKLGYIQFSDFVKQGINNETWYENKESGIKFKVPDGWNAGASQLASIALTSPDFTPFNERPSAASIPATGCWIGVSVKKVEIDDADYAITMDRLNHKDILNTLNTSSKTYGAVDVGEVTMLKTNLVIDSNKDNVGNVTSAELSQKNRFYSIETNLFGKDREICSQKFNDFLSTVVIQ